MVSRESVSEVFLPDKQDCLEYLRDHRWPNGVTCPHCKDSFDLVERLTDFDYASFLDECEEQIDSKMDNVFEMF